MIDPRDLDNCSLEDVNDVLEILGIELMACLLSPSRTVYIAMSSSEHKTLGLRWSKKSGFSLFTFSSPGRFLYEVLRDEGIIDFSIWGTSVSFENVWRGKTWEFMVECGLLGLG